MLKHFAINLQTKEKKTKNDDENFTLRAFRKYVEDFDKTRYFLAGNQNEWTPTSYNTLQTRKTKQNLFDKA